MNLNTINTIPSLPWKKTKGPKKTTPFRALEGSNKESEIMFNWLLPCFSDWVDSLIVPTGGAYQYLVSHLHAVSVSVLLVGVGRRESLLEESNKQSEIMFD
jgi:hypothetical protein